MAVLLYGAATGRRGGFTGGYTMGVERKLFENLIFDAGGYVGAGGRVPLHKEEG